MAQATVLYLVNVGGNAVRALGEMGDALKRVGHESDRVKSGLEKTGSLMGGVFGDLADVTVDLGSEVADLAMKVGGLGGAAIATVGGMALLTGAAVFVAKATKEWLDGVVELRKELAAQGSIVGGASAGLVRYEVASDRLDLALSRLKVSLADEIAPAMAEVLDATSALANVVSTLSSGVGELAGAFDKALVSAGPLGAILSSTAGIGGAALGALAGYGSMGDIPFTTFGPELPAGFELDQTQRIRGMGAEPTLEQLQAGRMNQAMQRLAANKAQAAAYAQLPGPSTLAAIAKVGAGGQGSSIFESGETVDELDAQFWQQQFDAWLSTPAQALEVASEELLTGAKKFQFSAEGVAGLSAGLSGGGVSGVLSAAGGGPIGAIVSAIVGALKDPTILSGLFNQVLEIYTDLPSMLTGVLEGVIPNLIRQVPELMAGFATLGPSIVVSMIEAAPEIFAAVIEALLTLPKAFADAIFGKEGLVNRAGDALNPFNDGDVFGNLKGNTAKGGVLGTNLGAGAETKRILGVKVPFLETGGSITKDGLAYLHAGERVLNRNESRAYNSSIGTINVYGATDARRFTEELQSKIGPFGLGFSLTPFAGG